MKRVREFLNRHALAVLTLFAAGLLAHWFITHRGPQPVAEVTGCGVLGVRHGVVYLVRGSRILVTTGGPPHELARDTDIQNPRLADAGIFYLACPFKPPARRGELPTVSDAVLRRIPLSGGRPVQLPVHLRPSPNSFGPPNIAVTEDSIYWWDYAGSAEVPYHPLKAITSPAGMLGVGRAMGGSAPSTAPVKLPHTVTDYTYRLVAVPVNGGTAVALNAVSHTGSFLIAGRRQVYWWESRLGRQRLYAMEKGDPTPRLLREDASYTMNINRMAHEVGGRVYWTESDVRSVGALRSDGGRQRLVSCRTDGTDFHSIGPLPVGATDAADRKRLYLLSVERAQNGRVVTRCYRADSTGRKLREAGAIPMVAPSGWLDGSDYCFETKEERDSNWFDWSQKGLTPRFVSVLYRCSLPD